MVFNLKNIVWLPMSSNASGSPSLAGRRHYQSRIAALSRPDSNAIKTRHYTIYSIYIIYIKKIASAEAVWQKLFFQFDAEGSAFAYLALLHVYLSPVVFLYDTLGQ